MKRQLDDTLFRMPQFGALDCTAKLLYLGMIASADDQGRLLADAAYLRSLVFPFDVIATEGIEVALGCLVAAGYLHLYDAGGMPLAQLPHWWSTQALQYAQPSRYPAPEGWEDHLRFTYTRGVIVTHNWLRKDGTRCPDTCDERGNPFPETAVSARAEVAVAAAPNNVVGATPEPAAPVTPPVAPPPPTAATGFQWRSDDPDPHNDKNRFAAPDVDSRISFAVKQAEIDPRKFVAGSIPRGKGETPIEVYYEFVDIYKHQVSKFNLAEMQAAVSDLTRWRSVLAEWFGRQYAPGKIACRSGLLDWYKHGIPDGNTKATSNNSSNADAKEGGGAGHDAKSAPGRPGAGTPVELGKRASLGADAAKALFARRNV